MAYTSDTGQLANTRTEVTAHGGAHWRDSLPSLKGVKLLTQRNADPQTQVDLTTIAEDSLSRSPSRETEIVVLPSISRPKVSSVVLQKWEGFVLACDTETFTGRLTPLVGEGGDQIAEIYCDEIDDSDRMLLAPGAVFYWSIGYLDKPSGRERFSQIRFRRLPVWSATELQTAENKASKLGELLDAAMVQ